jgi:hypothetical protein
MRQDKDNGCYFVINEIEDYKININDYKGDDITTYIKNCIEEFYKKHDEDFEEHKSWSYWNDLVYNLTDIKKMIISANKDIQLQFEIDFELDWYITGEDGALKTGDYKIIDVKHCDIKYDKVNEKWVVTPYYPKTNHINLDELIKKINTSLEVKNEIIKNLSQTIINITKIYGIYKDLNIKDLEKLIETL